MNSERQFLACVTVEHHRIIDVNVRWFILWFFCDGNRKEERVVFPFYCKWRGKIVAQNDAMSTDMPGCRICNTICTLIGSAIHCVFVIL